MSKLDWFALLVLLGIVGLVARKGSQVSNVINSGGGALAAVFGTLEGGNISGNGYPTITQPTG